MPVARASNAIGTGAYVTVPDAMAGEPLVQGEAVALTPMGIVCCSASYYGNSFAGFVLTNLDPGKPVAIVSMRGSVVTPIVEGGGRLVPGERVFLSNTPGEVSASPPVGVPGAASIQVGVATSDTAMILLTDLRVTILG